MSANPNEKRRIEIDRLSCASLLIEIKSESTTVGKATGFIAKHKGVYHLITNKHVVTGKDTFTGALLGPSGMPDSITVWQNKLNNLGRWVADDIKLYDPRTGDPVWYQHENPKVDIIALPLLWYNNIEYLSVPEFSDKYQIEVQPAETVSIVGFPFGKGSVFNFAIWKTGHIASDTDLDHEELPVFLIDATTKPSMSGSPVYFRRYNYSFVDKTTKQLGHVAIITKFLGIYSGRIGELFDVGMVWKPKVIEEIFDRVQYFDENGNTK